MLAGELGDPAEPASLERGATPLLLPRATHEGLRTVQSWEAGGSSDTNLIVIDGAGKTFAGQAAPRVLEGSPDLRTGYHSWDVPQHRKHNHRGWNKSANPADARSDGM